MKPDSYQPTATLSYLGLGVENTTTAASFYRDVVGLSDHETSGDGNLRLGWGAGSHVLEIASGDGLRHYGLELPRDGALDELSDRLSALGVRTETLHIERDRPGGLAFLDLDGHRIEAHGPVNRSAEHSADPGRRPIRIQHLTLASPRVPELAAFYGEALGLRISDRLGDSFIWLRANREHHTIAIAEADDAGLDHYAYEVGSWGDLKTWCDELAVRGVPITWGPGRHGPGNNLFVFFDDPDDNRIELSCEMERFWDESAAYPPRDWRQGPLTVNLWGVTPSWRQRVLSPGD